MHIGKRKSSIGRLLIRYRTSWKMRLASKLVLLGLVYGYISALHNQNPYYPVPGESRIPEEYIDGAWDWQPSPCWVPSYLLCKVPGEGERVFGITYTRSGYLFRSNAHRLLYRCTSTILGGFMGLLIAIGAVKIIMVRQGSRPDLRNMALPDSSTAKNKGK